ncbi:MAG TPA: hypothetical protein VH136_06610 [Trebonia sp.]|nr:hypothetical protein [Trebonia sp.]
MALTLGVVIAVSSHSSSTNVNQQAFRNRFGGFTRGDLAAGPNAQDAAGNAFSFNQTAAQALNTMDCTLTVPANPLTAQGLATPWQLGDGCSWANGGTEGAFVEATILAPNGQVQVYDPLVVTQGTTPAVAPTAPTIAAGSQVIISAGFNGNALALTGVGAAQGGCIDALGNSIINQTPQCNAVAFYQLANQEIANGTLTVPPTGTGKDGQPCETTTSFPLIDQDQSDNVDASYLFNPNTGQTAQNTAANAANMAGATSEGNGSDDGLLDAFVNPALGCTPFTATNTTAPAGTSSSQALNALSARQNQPATPALLPVNDPQLLVGGNFSVAKTNVYRAETDQPLLPANTSTAQNAATYCQNMVNLQTPVLKLDAPMETGASPVPALGSTLANFLAARENASFTNLNCQNFGLTNPVTLTLDGNGVAIGATYNTATQTANANGGAAAAPSASASTCPSATAMAAASASTSATAAAASASTSASAAASASPSATAAASVSPSATAAASVSPSASAAASPPASAAASASPTACAPAASASPTATASTGTHRHMNPRLFMPGSRFHM